MLHVEFIGGTFAPHNASCWTSEELDAFLRRVSDAGGQKAYFSPGETQP